MKRITPLHPRTINFNRANAQGGTIMLNEMSVPAMLSIGELLEKDLYTYANYERLQRNAEKKGKSLKGSKEFYALRIVKMLDDIFDGEPRKGSQISDKEKTALDALKKELKGKSKSHISSIVADLVMKQVECIK